MRLVYFRYGNLILIFVVNRYFQDSFSWIQVCLYEETNKQTKKGLHSSITILQYKNNTNLTKHIIFEEIFFRIYETFDTISNNSVPSTL